MLDVKNNMIQFMKKNRKLFVSAAVILFLFISVNVCVEINYAFISSKVENTVPEYRLDKFYYNYLSYREQILYNTISKAFDTCAEYSDTLPYKYTVTEFDCVMKYLIADNPKYFYINASSADLLSSRYKSRVKCTYFNTPEEIEIMQTELNMAIDAAQMSVDENSDEFTREVALHDYLIRNCTFAETELTEGGIYNTAYGALVLGKAYSDGYALALKLLYDRNDIFNLVVYGTVYKTPHMWNMVYIEQKFYHVDASWNDADLYFEPDLMFHGYFNLSDELILLDHKPDNKTILPSANDNKTYYHKNETYVDSVVTLKRIVERELLKAGYAKRNYLELFLDLSGDTEEYYDIIIEVIKRVNNLQDDFKFLPVYREYNASYSVNAVTIRLFYEN